MALETLSEHACFGGVQGFYRSHSAACAAPMRFGVFRPPQAAHAPVPALVYLAGLTCTEETFAIKAGAQRVAAELGLMLVTPDTSPRDTGIAGADAAWDFGVGAGFYLDATEAPWSRHWRMEAHVTQEIPALLAAHFPWRAPELGLFGHSMGGHGALTLGLRHPQLFRSVSAFAPITAPMACPWGVKAFSGYLGADRAAWSRHDATAMIRAGRRLPPLLVDQGLADKFLAEQLSIDGFETACREAGQPLTLRRHAGYDHGYWFVASFVEDHLRHHHRQLALDIRVDDLRGPEIRALLEEHLRHMHEVSPPESVHALDLAALRSPGITFWTVWSGAELLGCGALKMLDATHGEVKSMRTAAPHRGRGVGQAVLAHIVAAAQARGCTRLSLETGSMAAFEPARRLYAAFGFVPCGPFADYREDPNSVFMTRVLPVA